MGIWIKRLSFYELLCTWERVIMGKLVVQAYLSEHNTLIKSWSGTVDSMYKFSDYSSVQHAPCCRLHHLKKKKTKNKKIKTQKKKWKKTQDDKKGRAAVRYSSSQDREPGMCGEKQRFFGGGGSDAVVSVCCLVLLSASLFTVQFLNRWRPVFWWSLEEVEEGFCWAEEVEWAASRQNSDQHTGGKNIRR